MPFEGDNMMGVKRNNRAAALRVLHEEGGTSRKRLAARLGLTPAAITKIAGEMMGEGLLREGSSVPSGSAGRREILLEINARYGLALGVLINLRQAIVSAVWLDGTVLFSEELPLEPQAPAGPTADLLSGRLLALLEEHRAARDTVIGLGVAVRGVCSSDGRSVSDSFGALAEPNVPLCRLFEERTGFRTVMANNVRALFAAQMYLARDPAKGAQFFLRCEYGIGASLCIDGQIWHGVTEQCAEIGHIPVVPRGGKPCSCGKSGCLETIASPAAILEDARAALSETDTPVLWKLAEEKGADALNVNDVLSAALGGDRGASAIVDRAIAALSGALKSVIYLVDPGKIVLYGRLFENSYYLLRLLSEMREGVDARHAVVVEKSRYNRRLEDKAAALLAVQRFLDDGGQRADLPA